MNDGSAPGLSRRRALTIAAAAFLVPGTARAQQVRLFEWRGTALGAEARIALYHHDRAEAAAAVAAVAAEIERLENEFSLYRPDSALSTLNRDGVLVRPSLDMLRLLRESQRFGELTGGAFDVTVQPLWRVYADHFAANPDDEAGPPASVLARAKAAIDYRRLRIASDRIRLEPGMAVTLNGIAQGYITDRAADLLCARGWHHVLIDLGELRALDGIPDGRPWTVALRDPVVGGRTLASLPLRDRAAATSAGAATRFDRSGRHHHLFVPNTGRSAGDYRSVTVIADHATTADALATALAVTPRAVAPEVLRRGGSAEAWLIGRAGTVEHLTV